MVDKRVLLKYLLQQKQLSFPDFVFSKPIDLESLFGSKKNTFTVPGNSSKAETAKRSVISAQSSFQKKTDDTKNISEENFSLASRLSSLRPVDQLPTLKMHSSRQATENADSQSATDKKYTTYDEKRSALKALYYEGCTKCVLSRTRKTFVFGAGMVNAPVMVIGEAPGADEDEQGKPFVGAAGQLLTNMLSAIKLDRNKDIFITNVLKCRPPENRNPENMEIVSCIPLLQKQIEIIQPKAILLLGRIAAQSVLGLADSVAKLRSKTHMYKGIPAWVIYHPAALLRNAEYKRPAWEDLQKFQILLTDLGVYEFSK